MLYWLVPYWAVLLAALKDNVPASTNVWPVYVLLLVSVVVPAPSFVNFPAPLTMPEIVPVAGVVICNWLGTAMLPAATKEVPEPVPPAVNTTVLAINFDEAFLMLIAAPPAPVFSPLMLILDADNWAEPDNSTPLPEEPTP